MTADDQQQLINNIIAGLPGANDNYDLVAFQQMLDSYKNIDTQQLKENLYSFIKEVAPTAEEAWNLSSYPSR